MNERYHDKMVKAGHFLKLFKNDALFTIPVFRFDKKRKNLQFIIVFKMGNTNYYVLNHSKMGYSTAAKRLKFFSKSMLYQAMLVVPVKFRSSIQILQVPEQRKNAKSYLTYYEQETIDAILFGGEYLDNIYNPFRDAHSAVFSGVLSEIDTVSFDDYQGIQNFHPFLVVNTEYHSIDCIYKDTSRDKLMTLELMGWYYLGPQLKISWKPDKGGKDRWRSSLVAIDKKTGRYFFQGNLYNENGTDPVFLDSLSFSFKNKIPNSKAVRGEYERFIGEIKKQERIALLKLR